MRITTRGRYALRATIALAKLGKEGGPVSINCLAEEENISPVFLEQIFFRLRKAGIVSSVRGPGGGFCFTRALDKLTVMEILEASGEELGVSLCDKHYEHCARIEGCLSHRIWVELADRVNAFFESLTLASIIEKNVTGDLDPSVVLNFPPAGAARGAAD